MAGNQNAFLVHERRLAPAYLEHYVPQLPELFRRVLLRVFLVRSNVCDCNHILLVRGRGIEPRMVAANDVIKCNRPNIAASTPSATPDGPYARFFGAAFATFFATAFFGAAFLACVFVPGCTVFAFFFVVL